MRVSLKTFLLTGGATAPLAYASNPQRVIEAIIARHKAARAAEQAA